MSTVRQIFIYCDGEPDCDFRNEVWLPGEGTRTAAQQRKRLKFDGWSYKNGKDYCVDCTTIMNAGFDAPKKGG